MVKAVGWKPEDYIVAALAILIISGMFVRLYGVVFMGQPLSGDTARITENILSGVMAIISMYIGARIQKHRDKNE